MNFDYGVNAVVLTQLRGEPVPADFATRWSCSQEQANAGTPCSGTIEINEISDMHGGPVTGSFTALLVDSHQTDPPYEMKTITGNFIALRSKSQD